MPKRYRLLKEQFGIPVGTTFTRAANYYYKADSTNFGGNSLNLQVKYVENTPDLFEPVVERWKPVDGEIYWMPGESDAIDARWTEHQIDRLRLEQDRVFRTKEQALEAAKRIRKVLEDYHAELAEGEVSA